MVNKHFKKGAMMKARERTGVNISGQVSLSANLGVSDQDGCDNDDDNVLASPLLASSPALFSCVALIPPHTL